MGTEIAIELQPTIVEIVHLTCHGLKLFLGETEAETGDASGVETEVPSIERHMSDLVVKTLIVAGEVALGPPLTAGGAVLILLQRGTEVGDSAAQSVEEAEGPRTTLPSPVEMATGTTPQGVDHVIDSGMTVEIEIDLEAETEIETETGTVDIVGEWPTGTGVAAARGIEDTAAAAVGHRLAHIAPAPGPGPGPGPTAALLLSPGLDRGVGAEAEEGQYPAAARARVAPLAPTPVARIRTRPIRVLAPGLGPGLVGILRSNLQEFAGDACLSLSLLNCVSLQTMT